MITNLKEKGRVGNSSLRMSIRLSFCDDIHKPSLSVFNLKIEFEYFSYTSNKMLKLKV